MPDSTRASDFTTRLAAGDEQALAELFDDHRERLWRLVHFRMDRRLRGRVDPEDVLQDGYLAAMRRVGDYDGAPSPFIWLRIIVGQALVDAHRTHLGAVMRDAGREVDLLARTEATATSLANQLVRSMTSPSMVAARGEMIDLLEGKIGEMEPIDQEILALRHFEELTNSEVAEALGIQPKAASIRYVRAVQRLKVILSELPGFAEELRDG